MAKQIVKITESQLKQIVAESVNRILTERRGKINENDFELTGDLYGLQPLNGRELFDRISSYLERLGDVSVSNFYSDDQNIVVAAHKNARGKRGEIDKIMFNFGYKLYDASANDEYIYYTYKRG